MPIIKSAKKRVRTAKKATVRNAKTKKGLRGALKAFHGKITGNSHSSAQSAIDKAAKKGVISKNKASFEWNWSGQWQHKYKVTTILVNNVWKISYLEGFDYDEFLSNK